MGHKVVPMGGGGQGQQHPCSIAATSHPNGAQLSVHLLPHYNQAKPSRPELHCLQSALNPFYATSFVLREPPHISHPHLQTPSWKLSYSYSSKIIPETLKAHVSVSAFQFQAWLSAGSPPLQHPTSSFRRQTTPLSFCLVIL